MTAPSEADPPFEIRRSPMQGLGAFATRAIPADTRLVEYAGERLTPAEADARYPDVPGERHHTYLFAIDDDVVIDAAVGGNAARYINHSCDPNCEARQIGRRVFIVARRDIEPGEELTYDYRLEIERGASLARRRLYACRCGSPRCRGTMLLSGRRRRKRPAKRSG